MIANYYPCLINYSVYYMKRTSIYYFSLAAILAGSFASCQDDDRGFTEEEIRESAVLREFAKNFVTRYGEPDPNHTWGTDKPLKPIFEAGTRATDQNVNVNTNQWCERDPNNKTYKTGSNVLIDKFEIPGWPNFDGLYYTTGGKYNESDMFTHKDDKPIGDVTDYEIQFVSTWFRTHKNPTSIKLHLTDFFVQNVSQDYDQLQYLGAITGNGSVVGNQNDLGTLTEPGSNGIDVKHVNDVLQEGSNSYRTDYGYDLAPVIKKKSLTSNEELNYSSDYMHFGNIYTSEVQNGQSDLDNNWTHVNNFNAGNSNVSPEEHVGKTNNREIKFITSSGTENFACRPSAGTQGNWITNWVLVRLDWIEEGVHRYGYYLGFDYSTETNDTKVSPDGFYSNWIIKITPAYFAEGDYSKRVMCEDLGGSFDFDFNDVVFDIAYDGNKNENIITIQASGGTLPIIVGTNDETFEAHKMLGQDSYSNPINVIEGSSYNHEVAIYRVPAVYTSEATRNDYKMPIWVKQGDTWNNVNKDLPEKQNYEWDANGKKYSINSDMIPRKFVTEVSVQWAKELQGIDVAYDQFHLWVTNAKDNANWYTHIGDSSKIFNYVAKETTAN